MSRASKKNSALPETESTTLSSSFAASLHSASTAVEPEGHEPEILPRHNLNQLQRRVRKRPISSLDPASSTTLEYQSGNPVRKQSAIELSNANIVAPGLESIKSESSRVLYVDIDVHHGDGLCSSHSNLL